jgi:acetyl esterase
MFILRAKFIRAGQKPSLPYRLDFAQQVYASTEDFSNPKFAPMLTDDLRGLPPAVLIITEFDIFHDENKRYGQRLRDAGVTVYEKCYPGHIHFLVGLPPDAPEIQDGFNLVHKAMNESFKAKR